MANPRAYLAKIFDGAIDRWIGAQYDHEYLWNMVRLSITCWASIATASGDSIDMTQASSKPSYLVPGGVISVAGWQGIWVWMPSRSLRWTGRLPMPVSPRLRWVDGRSAVTAALIEHHYLKHMMLKLLSTCIRWQVWQSTILITGASSGLGAGMARGICSQRL